MGKNIKVIMGLAGLGWIAYLLHSNYERDKKISDLQDVVNRQQSAIDKMAVSALQEIGGAAPIQQKELVPGAVIKRYDTTPFSTVSPPSTIVKQNGAS